MLTLTLALLRLHAAIAARSISRAKATFCERRATSSPPHPGDGAITIEHKLHNGLDQTCTLHACPSPTMTTRKPLEARLRMRAAPNAYRLRLAVLPNGGHQNQPHPPRCWLPAGPQPSGSTPCHLCLSCTCSDSQPGRGSLTRHPCQLSSGPSPSLAENPTTVLYRREGYGKTRSPFAWPAV